MFINVGPWSNGPSTKRHKRRPRRPTNCSRGWVNFI